MEKKTLLKLHILNLLTSLKVPLALSFNNLDKFIKVLSKSRFVIVKGRVGLIWLTFTCVHKTQDKDMMYQ